MPTWNDILAESKSTGSIYDGIRRRYLKELFELTGRNSIIYYSGWLHVPGAPDTDVNEKDKNGLMAAIHHLDRDKGLDLILHTPGGDIAATESIVFYLHKMFQDNIRAIVPQIAMSAGTMIALACKEIVMGKHSSIGPIDPQIAGTSAHSLLEEFNRAHQEFKADNTRGFVWQPIISKYPATIIGECEKAIKWSEEIVAEWLNKGMFNGMPDAKAKTAVIIKELGDHALTKSHSRRISIDRAKEIGLKIVDLEASQELQEAVMSVHHACMVTLDATKAAKIIENHEGIAYIAQLQQIAITPQIQSI